MFHKGPSSFVKAVTTVLSAAIIVSLPMWSPASGCEQPNSTEASKALSRWRDNKLKQGILDFIGRVTDPHSKDFVPPEDRVAVFDNDGTLLCEKPAFIQVIFARDSAVERQGDHPEWKNDEAIKPFLTKDDNAIAGLRGAEATKLIAATQNGMSSEELPSLASKWITDAKHKRFNRPFVQLKYEPMIELLSYLRSKGFKTYICSGAGADFIRLYSKDSYGIPGEQVIGSSLKREFTQKDGRSAVVSRPVLHVYNVGPHKPIMIDEHIGKRPLIAVGNSDGDIEMLTYCTDRKGPSLGILLHHDDEQREYKYDKGAEKALKLASERGWTVVSIKDDFENVFAADNKDTEAK
ncbi:MAG: haloacid dehalogenase-like hydrolase [Candidatus Melainabacteria bacterium]|nr:MAG: haloacid dehalogenase-like hydrolase [Candidatus Melainabacteria bacterium]